MPLVPIVDHFGAITIFGFRRVAIRESLGTGYSSIEPSGQRTCTAVMGEALLTTSVDEFCDQ
jgi:hypothetical protein